MQKIQTRYGSIAYEEHGQGLPVVLLHANAGDHHDFDSIIPALSNHYRVIAMDFPGFGESDACNPPGATTGTYMATALEEFITGLRLESAVFIGNSLGGYSAARLAITQPKRVLALVLVDTGGFTAHTAFSRLFCRVKGSEQVTRLIDTQFARWYLKRRNSFVEAIIARTDSYRQSPARVTVNAALWRSFIQPEYDLRPCARDIQSPTLLIWGRRDPVLRVEDGKTAQALIPHARLITIDTGHMPFAEAPEEFLSSLMPFLQEVQANAVSASHP